MRLLFDLGHPAHVHLFRNLIKRVSSEGGDVLAATREKDVTVDLCEAYSIPQKVLSRAYSGNIIDGFREFFQRTAKLLRLAYKFKPDALLGTSMSIGIVGRIINRPSFVFGEDDAHIVPMFAYFAYPTCNYVVTPDCLRHENYGAKHLMYPGYHELAYLHPDHFTPDPTVPRSIGLDIDKPYFVIRFVSLKAHHDIRAGGLPFEAAQRLVDILSNHGRVLITTEGQLHDEFKKYQFPLPPEKLHDVLAFASMYIGDSQTVSIETAVLGVPGMRCNTFVGRITCLEELEKKYGLTVGFLPDETDMLIAKTQEWIAELENVKRQMQTRRTKMLEEKINLVDWQWRMLCERLSL
jgi:predicted glycosyltransferase